MTRLLLPKKRIVYAYLRTPPPVGPFATSVKQGRCDACCPHLHNAAGDAPPATLSGIVRIRKQCTEGYDWSGTVSLSPLPAFFDPCELHCIVKGSPGVNGCCATPPAAPNCCQTCGCMYQWTAPGYPWAATGPPCGIFSVYLICGNPGNPGCTHVSPTGADESWYCIVGLQTNLFGGGPPWFCTNTCTWSVPDCGPSSILSWGAVGNFSLRACTGAQAGFLKGCRPEGHGGPFDPLSHISTPDPDDTAPFYAKLTAGCTLADPDPANDDYAEFTA